MKKIKLHASGPSVSPIAAGMWRLHEWQLSEKKLTDWIETSVGLGITTFDHADLYGGYTVEEIFGRVLTSSLRQKIEIVTKCGICLNIGNRPQYRVKHYNTTADHIIKSAEQSLKNLQTDYLDMLLIHRPDPLMNAEETARGLDELIRSGKVKHAGVSNFNASQFDLLQSKLSAPLVTNQIEFSLLHTTPLFDGTLDHAQKNEYRPMIWSPLGGGGLFKADGERESRLRHVLQKMADKYDAAPDQVAYSWLMMHPSGPVPVTGTGKTDRLSGAAGSAKLILDRQDWFILLEAAGGAEVP